MDRVFLSFDYIVVFGYVLIRVFQWLTVLV